MRQALHGTDNVVFSCGRQRPTANCKTLLSRCSLSGSIFPSVGLPVQMDNGQDVNPGVGGRKEHPVWKPPKQCPTDLASDNGKLHLYQK